MKNETPFVALGILLIAAVILFNYSSEPEGTYTPETAIEDTTKITSEFDFSALDDTTLFSIATQKDPLAGWKFTCKDSDGINYFKQGKFTFTMTNPAGKSYTEKTLASALGTKNAPTGDYCRTPKQLTEFYCPPAGGKFLSCKYITCSNGCYAGMCRPGKATVTLTRNMCE